MSRIDELIAELCPEGVEFKELDELLDYEQPVKYLVDSTAYDNSHATPVLTAGQTFILGYTDETNGIYPASPENPVIIFDDFTTAFKWVDFPFKAKSSAMKMITPKSDFLESLRYAYYAMQTITYVPQDHARQWIGTYSKFSIPMPPREIQREIVKVLDTFTQLEAELEAELEARRRQYQYYRDALLSFDERTDADASKQADWAALSEVCQVTRGRVISRDYLRDHPGTFPVYSSQTADAGVFGFIDTYDYDCESITWTTDGANAGSVFYHRDEKFSITNVCGLIRALDDTKVSTKFLYYMLGQLTKQYVSSGMGNPKLMSNVMSRIKVPVPPLDEQERIVAILDKFDALVNDLTSGLPAEIKARRQQYEHYRDRLLTFREAA